MAVIFFDYDGVLVDSLTAEAEYVLPLCKEYGIHQIQNKEDLARLCQGDFYQSCIKEGVNLEALNKVYKDYMSKENHQLPLFEEVADIVTTMGEKHHVYFATANSKSQVEKTLKDHHIKNVIEVMGHEYSSGKIKKFADKKEKHPNETCYFITDSKGDIVEAHNSVVDVIIGITWGWHSKDVIQSAKPHHCFDTPKELKNFLNTI